jgi:hypothetical protein
MGCTAHGDNNAPMRPMISLDYSAWKHINASILMVSTYQNNKDKTIQGCSLYPIQFIEKTAAPKKEWRRMKKEKGTVN